MKKTGSGGTIRPRRKLVEVVQYEQMTERLNDLDRIIQEVGGIASFSDRVTSVEIVSSQPRIPLLLSLQQIGCL